MAMIPSCCGARPALNADTYLGSVTARTKPRKRAGTTTSASARRRAATARPPGTDRRSRPPQNVQIGTPSHRDLTKPLSAPERRVGAHSLPAPPSPPGCAALVVRTEAGWSPSLWDTPLAQAAATRGPGWLRVGPLARLGVARLWS